MRIIKLFAEGADILDERGSGAMNVLREVFQNLSAEDTPTRVSSASSARPTSDRNALVCPRALEAGPARPRAAAGFFALSCER